MTSPSPIKLRVDDANGVKTISLVEPLPALALISPQFIADPSSNPAITFNGDTMTITGANGVAIYQKQSDTPTGVVFAYVSDTLSADAPDAPDDAIITTEPEAYVGPALGERVIHEGRVMTVNAYQHRHNQDDAGDYASFDGGVTWVAVSELLPAD